jgi:hypothetical protein
MKILDTGVALLVIAMATNYVFKVVPMNMDAARAMIPLVMFYVMMRLFFID